MRKILFPIYFKLVVFILIILGLSLSAYVYYATTLFQNDKVSYVYEGVDDYNFNQYLGLENKISYYKKILELMMLSGNSFDNSWSVLKKNNNIFAFFNLSKHKVSSVVSLLKRSQLDALYTQNFQTIPKSGFIISGEHIYFMGMSNKKNSGIMLNLESVLSRSESSLYESSYIINKQPSTNAQKKLIGKIFKENRFGQSFFAELDKSYIVSARKLTDSLILMTLADYNKALSASTTLRTNSLYFGLMIAGVAIIFVLLMSRLITAPINSLAQTVNSFFTTEFKTRSLIKAQDEVGFLATSFNHMADKIVQYMQEMKKKIRLEEELKTAQLVQANFFPQKKYLSGPCHIFGVYESATECGGDWWGVLAEQDHSIVIIADVTGHGTSAALMTAILHNSLTALKYLIAKDTQYLTDADKVMSFLNESFLNGSSNLNASAFVLCINHKEQQLNYCNASHNPPFYLPNKQKTLTKIDIIPLINGLGLRLGESLKSPYTAETLKLTVGDRVILFTDGLLESRNIGGNIFGQRKFIKEILNNQENNLDCLIENISNNFKDFIGETSLEDDFTLVGFELEKRSVYKHNISIGEFPSYLEFNSNTNTVDWLYQGSFLSLIDLIPSYFQKIIPLSYYKKNGFNTITNYGESLISITFVQESSSEIESQVANRLAEVDMSHTFSDLKRYITLVSIELVRNAIIVNKAKKKIHLHISQTQDDIIIEVCDPYGALTCGDITGRLKKIKATGEYEMKKSGAGLGLFMVISSVNYIRFNIDVGRRTEVICSINKYKRLKDFKQKEIAIFYNEGK